MLAAANAKKSSRMEDLLAALRAVAEPTRLRLVVLCARGELTVSELTEILGQSQPRVSRHLKLLCAAGLLDRFREGSWAFYRLRQSSPVGALARQLVQACSDVDPTIALDLQRLGAIKRQRADVASAYFRENAAARVNLDRAGLENGQVRLGDMYRLALPDASFDAVVVHQVLHYADRPAAVIAEAARVLRPSGILILVDFAPHKLEFLRDEHAHRRLGFADSEVAEWCTAAGLEAAAPRSLPGDPLTVVVWTAQRPAAARPRSADDMRARIPGAVLERELR